MKAIVSNKSCTNKLPYPKLMILKNSYCRPIVLFQEPKIGVCVDSGGSINEIGKISNTWLEEEKWEDFNGSVCLENDK